MSTLMLLATLALTSSEGESVEVHANPGVGVSGLIPRLFPDPVTGWTKCNTKRCYRPCPDANPKPGFKTSPARHAPCCDGASEGSVCASGKCQAGGCGTSRSAGGGCGEPGCLACGPAHLGLLQRRAAAGVGNAKAECRTGGRSASVCCKSGKCGAGHQGGCNCCMGEEVTLFHTWREFFGIDDPLGTRAASPCPKCDGVRPWTRACPSNVPVTPPTERARWCARNCPTPTPLQTPIRLHPSDPNLPIQSIRTAGTNPAASESAPAPAAVPAPATSPMAGRAAISMDSWARQRQATLATSPAPKGVLDGASRTLTRSLRSVPVTPAHKEISHGIETVSHTIPGTGRSASPRPATPGRISGTLRLGPKGRWVVERNGAEIELDLTFPMVDYRAGDRVELETGAGSAEGLVVKSIRLLSR